MTSIRKLFGEAVGFGERYCLDLAERDGELVATHPSETIPIEIVVRDGLDRLSERPPTEPVLVEILREFDGNRVVGRVVATNCDEAEN